MYKDEWREVFLICAEVYVFGAIIYLILARGEKQWWADGVEGKCGGWFVKRRLQIVKPDNFYHCVNCENILQQKTANSEK